MGFLVWHHGVCAFGVHTTDCLETYCQWARVLVLHRSVLLKATLGQAGASEHWAGAAEGLARSRACYLHSPREGTRFLCIFVEGIPLRTGLEPVSPEGSVEESWWCSHPREADGTRHLQPCGLGVALIPLRTAGSHSSAHWALCRFTHI